MLSDSIDVNKPGLLSLSGDDLKSRLEQLTPEHTDVATFASLLTELKNSANSEYMMLRELADQTIDCCGTGGSGKDRFNTSTAVAFVLAASGLRVAKFGNRAVSGKSGSFDFLSALGFIGTLSASRAAKMLEHSGLTFLYAPDVYPQLASLSALRKALGRPTVLNFAGPLLNPVNPRYRLMGVSVARMQELIAEVLASYRPAAEAFVVRSSCGLDEFCAGCQSDVVEVKDNALRRKAVSRQILLAEDRSSLHSDCTADQAIGCNNGTAGQLTASRNARRFFEIVDGSDSSSPAYRLVVLNSAAALQLAKPWMSLSDLISEVKQLIASGELKRTYLRLRNVYESYTR